MDFTIFDGGSHILLKFLFILFLVEFKIGKFQM